MKVAYLMVAVLFAVCGSTLGVPLWLLAWVGVKAWLTVWSLT